MPPPITSHGPHTRAPAALADEFGLAPGTFCDVLRSMRIDTERRAELAEASGANFLEWDRSRDGTLHLGDAFPDAPLAPLYGPSGMSMASCCAELTGARNPRSMVILAGPNS